MRDEIENVLEKFVRPGLRMDGGDVEVVDVDESEGIVKVKLTGACGGCPMSQMTLQMGVEKVLKEKIPSIKSVVSVN